MFLRSSLGGVKEGADADEEKSPAALRGQAGARRRHRTHQGNDGEQAERSRTC